LLRIVTPDCPGALQNKRMPTRLVQIWLAGEGIERNNSSKDTSDFLECSGVCSLFGAVQLQRNADTHQVHGRLMLSLIVHHLDEYRRELNVGNPVKKGCRSVITAKFNN